MIANAPMNPYVGHALNVGVMNNVCRIIRIQLGRDDRSILYRLWIPKHSLQSGRMVGQSE